MFQHIASFQQKNMLAAPLTLAVVLLVCLCGPAFGQEGSFTEQVNQVFFKMNYVEGGTFTWMCKKKKDCFRDNKPIFSFTVPSFRISETEVTQELWKEVMHDNPSYDSESYCDDCPVNMISWDDIQIFLQELNRLTGKNYRLPTSAEWEFAARGGNLSLGYIYSGSNNLNEVAWYKDNSEGVIHPVKEKKPNELGLYDMSGNVLEWCLDVYGAYPSKKKIEPYMGETPRFSTIRGGSCDNNEMGCSFFRNWYSLLTGAYSESLGFRLVLP